MDVPEIRTRQARILRLMFALARIRPWLVSPLLALDRLLYRGNPKRAVQALASMMTPPDRRFLQENARVAEAFVSSLAEAYRQGVRGPMLEAALIARARGFDLGRILAPVHVFQGGHDGNVPPEMGRYLARSLQQAELHFRPDEGHLSIVWTCFDECLQRLVTREGTCRMATPSWRREEFRSNAN
jgi:pimeloyl-ACP methyl ester carboxylesterase